MSRLRNQIDRLYPYPSGRDVPLALGYCIPEKLTDGTYNLLALAVDSSLQGSGIGSQMMRYLEQKLQKNGGRILIIDTSGDKDYRGTRQFYERLGYENVAVIKDFWKEGDDKITYYKRLAQK